MKSITKLGFLCLLATATVTEIKPTEVVLTEHFTTHLNTAFSDLLNGDKSLQQVLTELEIAAQKENHPTLQKEIGFLKQNCSAIILYRNKFIQLFDSIKIYLTDTVRTRIENLQLGEWLKIITRK